MSHTGLHLCVCVSHIHTYLRVQTYQGQAYLPLTTFTIAIFILVLNTTSVLISCSSARVDFSTSFRDVEQSLSNAQGLYSRWQGLLDDSAKAGGQECEWVANELRNVLKSIEWDLEDLTETVNIVESNPGKFRLSPQEIEQRKGFIYGTRDDVKVRWNSYLKFVLWSMCSLMHVTHIQCPELGYVQHWCRKQNMCLWYACSTHTWSMTNSLLCLRSPSANVWNVCEYCTSPAVRWRKRPGFLLHSLPCQSWVISYWHARFWFMLWSCLSLIKFFLSFLLWPCAFVYSKWKNISVAFKQKQKSSKELERYISALCRFLHRPMLCFMRLSLASRSLCEKCCSVFKLRSSESGACVWCYSQPI